MQEADRIDSIAARLSDLSQRKFGNTLQNVSVNWKGDNSVIYINKGRELQRNMNGTAAEMRDVASNIRKVARQLYRAEMAALQIAQQREY